MKGDTLMAWWVGLIIGIVCLLGGAIAGFFIARKIFAKQLEKNPPITRDMIRAMFMQMGRKPSEADINRVMASMKNGK
jgi:uncharacterized protein YneF (UPF0154 family)